MLFDQVEQTTATVDSATTADDVVKTSAATEVESTTQETSEDVLAGTELENQPTEPEESDFEYEGATFKVPKTVEGQLKEALMRHADYTRKTQEIGEQRRTFDTEREQFKQVVQTQQALIKEVAQITAIDGELQQLQGMDWNKLIAENPQQAQALQVRYTQLQAQRGQLVFGVTQKQQQMQLEQQRESAKRANEAEAIVASVFKDWSPQRLHSLNEYAKSEGVSPQQLAQTLINAPHFAKTINKAIQWDQYQKQRSSAPKAPPPPKPVTRVTGGSASNTKSPSDMNAEEYAVWRRERNQRTR